MPTQPPSHPLAEGLRVLGYGRSVSMESFRAPNFQLVADIVVFLAARVDPDAVLISPAPEDNEMVRVAFVKDAVQMIVNKAGVKVNPKKLYGADGLAVKELLKVISILLSARNMTVRCMDDRVTRSFFSRAVQSHSRK